MRQFLAFLLVTIFQTAHSQDSLSYRTAIGVNIAPVLTRLLGGLLDDEKIQVALQHQFNEKYSFKTKFSISKYHYSPSILNLMFQKPFKSTIIEQTDSTETTEDKFLERTNVWELYLSIERWLKIKKVYFTVGLGLIPGIVKNRTLTYYSDYKYGNWMLSSLQAVNDYYSFKIGATPYLAVILPLNKRLYLLAQTNFEWNFYFGKQKAFDGSPDKNYSFSDFSSYPIIGELSLMYRFNKK